MKEIPALKRAFRTAYEHKQWFLISSVMDLLLLLAYGFATAPIYAKLMLHIQTIGALGTDAVAAATREGKSMLSVLVSESIKPYFYNTLILLLILGITVYLLYCLFQAFNWKIALQLTGKKIKYMDYLKKFLRVNIIWFLLFVLYYVLGFVIEIRKILITTITQAEPSGALNIILTFLLILIAYFAVISYVKLSVRKSLYIGKSRIRQLLPSVLIFAIYLLALQMLITYLFTINFSLAVILGLLLFIPALTIARIYITLIIQKM
ncbi:hypothetical protein KY346_05270 [Candidatus Woesearchaeota archaeon]|nr:hypothetical protein [Candidatus Woesearchaeota archaeon]